MLEIASHSDFPALYDLLRESFPEDEYRPYDAQLALLQEPKYALYTGPDRNFLISVWRFRDFAFIEHFAVSPALRGQGMGTQILRELLLSLACPVVLEAELPETELACRRLDFYRRSGLVVNSFPYLQPSYGIGRKEVPMCLLSTRPALTDDSFHTIRDTLYREVYKVTGRS